jgi:dipeptidyl aminopeptidase/acylaminoacyl peptidase
VRPLLIGQATNDLRVKHAEAEQIDAAIENNGGCVTYALYTDGGHGLARPESNLDFFARAEACLAEHLGGGCEPAVAAGIRGHPRL